MHVKIKSSFLLIILIMAGSAGIILWNQNTLREAFYSLRSSFELEEYLLECRRQEKNYFLRFDTESIQLHQAHFDSLEGLTGDLVTATLNPAMRQKFVALDQALSSYKTTFDNIIRTGSTSSTAGKNFQDPSNNLVREARRIHTIIFGIRTNATGQFNKIRSTTHVINLAALLVSLFLAVIIAGYLSDKITEQARLKR